MLYLAYLDEFGHVGPFISRDHPEHKTSPLFGIGGFALPHGHAREFSSWFYRLRNHLLAYEIQRDGVSPSRWEKRGSALLTTTNIERYGQLTRAMRRILSKIASLGGFIIYVGFEKQPPGPTFTSERLYGGVLRRVLKRLNGFARTANCEYLVILDDNDKTFSRDVILKKAQQIMFGTDYCDRLIETPLQVESLIYHNVQAADWVCGLLGRYGAYTLRPQEYSEFKWARERFGSHLLRTSRYSGILTSTQLNRHYEYAVRRKSIRAAIDLNDAAPDVTIISETNRGS